MHALPRLPPHHGIYLLGTTSATTHSWPGPDICLNQPLRRPTTLSTNSSVNLTSATTWLLPRPNLRCDSTSSGQLVSQHVVYHNLTSPSTDPCITRLLPPYKLHLDRPLPTADLYPTDASTQLLTMPQPRLRRPTPILAYTSFSSYPYTGIHYILTLLCIDVVRQYWQSFVKETNNPFWVIRYYPYHFYHRSFTFFCFFTLFLI